MRISLFGLFILIHVNQSTCLLSYDIDSPPQMDPHRQDVQQHGVQQHQQRQWQEFARSSSTSQQCFPFTFMCECAFVINHSVPFNHTQQQHIFDSFLAWNISDIRLLSAVKPACRHAIIACLCGLAFPQCTSQLDGTIEIIPVCVDVCATTLPSMCTSGQSRANTISQTPNHPSSQLPNKTLSQSIHQSHTQPYSQLDTRRPDSRSHSHSRVSLSQVVRVASPNQTQCYDITPLPPTIPILTCLPEGEVNCCTDLLYMDPNTRECAIVCLNRISEENERRLEIVMLVLAWTSTVAVIIGTTPFLLDSYGRSFPNHIPLCVVISANISALIMTSGSYTNAFQPGSFTCDRYSSSCIAQMFFLSWAILNIVTYVTWMTYRIFHSIFVTEFPKFDKVFLNLANKPSHIFIVHFSTNAFSFTCSLTSTLIARDSFHGPAIAPGGFCIPNLAENGQFYSYFVPTTLILALLTTFLSMIFVLFARINREFVLLQIRATAFSVWVFINTALSLSLIYANLGGAQEEIVKNAIECSVTHPRLDDPPCNTDLTSTLNFGHYTSCLVFDVILPTLTISCISLTHIEVWQWWADVILCRPFVPISSRLNPYMVSDDSSKLSHANLKRRETSFRPIDAQFSECLE